LAFSIHIHVQTFHIQLSILFGSSLENEDEEAFIDIPGFDLVVGVSNLEHLVQNVVDLGFAGRAGALRYGARRGSVDFDCDLSIVKDGCIGALPVLALFDFAAAFPSVAHAWIRAVLLCINIPRGVLCAFDALYEGNEAYWQSGGFACWLFTVVSGVLQGCPLSGSLFVLAIDPLLVLFERYVMRPGLGTVTACADDIGAFGENLGSLPILQVSFSSFQGASGLTLKPVKCVLVPVAVFCSNANRQRIQVWLRRHVQGWQFFRVDPAGKYLGLFLGPGAGVSKQWGGPVTKLRER
jgi:hypothetical protein